MEGQHEHPGHDGERFQPVIEHKVKQCGVAFFDTQESARSQYNTLVEFSRQCEQLNIVIREECKSYDKELMKLGKVYCGAIWWQIHERRAKEGWYSKELIYATTQSQKF